MESWSEKDDLTQQQSLTEKAARLSQIVAREEMILAPSTHGRFKHGLTCNQSVRKLRSS